MRVNFFNLIYEFSTLYFVLIFKGIFAYCLRVPKNQGIDPLVSEPTRIIYFSQHIPLTRTWHCFLQSDVSCQNQIRCFIASWEFCNGRHNFFLLQYLLDFHCITCQISLFSFSMRLTLELSFQSPKRFFFEPLMSPFINVYVTLGFYFLAP